MLKLTFVGLSYEKLFHYTRSFILQESCFWLSAETFLTFRRFQYENFLKIILAIVLEFQCFALAP